MNIAGIALLILSPFIGSFLALLAYRLPEHEDVIFERSKCRSCGHVLAIRDLIPLLSFAINRAKCRFCAAAISFAYPLMELGAILIAASALWATTSWLIAITCVLGWTMLVLFVTDVQTMKLPNVLTVPLIPAGLIVTYVIHGSGRELLDAVVGAAAGGAGLWATAMLYQMVRRRKGLGMGDVKLFAAAGAWLGWQALPFVMLGACVVVLAGGVLFFVARRLSIKGHTMLPLGAGLAPAIYLIWLLEVPVRPL